uniref:Cyclin-dependent kinase inhibitor domain-containing protein n=1 Tax=Scylla olivacea TaxID=85551 RepID=A0A0P4WGH8_SCYOL
MAVLQSLKRVRTGWLNKRSSARRTITFGKDSNSQDNVKIAERLSSISAQNCKRKWNFDVNKGVPVSGGRFSWAPLAPPPDLTPVATPGDLKLTSTTAGHGSEVKEGQEGREKRREEEERKESWRKQQERRKEVGRKR